MSSLSELAQQTATPALNVSSGYADAFGMGGVVLLVMGAILVIVAAQFLAPWLAKSNILKSVFGGFLVSFVYALKGAAALIAAGALVTPFWLVTQMDSGTRSALFEYGGYAVGGYLGLAVIGWLADRAVTRYIEAHPTYESLADMWPETPDEDEPAEVAD